MDFKNKSDAHGIIKDFSTFCATQYPKHKIKAFRLDGGTEYSLVKLDQLCKEVGQRLEVTTAYAPWQDGRSERAIRIVVERLRKAVIAMNIPLHLWNEVFQGVLHIVNRTATSTLDGKTPIEAFMDQVEGNEQQSNRPDVSHLRVLGSKAYVLIPPGDPKRVKSRKLDARAEIGVLIGYEGAHIYRVFVKGKVVRSSNVRFDESALESYKAKAINLNPGTTFEVSSDEEEEDAEMMDTDITGPNSGVTVKKLRVDRQNDQEGARHQIELAPNDENDMSVLTDNDEEAFRDALEQVVDDGLSAAEAEEATDDDATITDSEQRGSVTPVPKPPKAARRRKEWPVVPPGKRVSTRSIAKKTGEKLQSQAMVAKRAFFLQYAMGAEDPKSLKEALAGPYVKKWTAAIFDEYMSLSKRKVFKLIKRASVKQKVLSGKLVFRVKRDANGQIIKWKARYVVRGFEQQYGRDFDETFAGTSKSTTWRIMIALAAKDDMEIHQMDAIAAFLQEDIDGDVFIEVPPQWAEILGVKQGVDETEGMVCKLLKALYGLKQSPRLWQKKLRRVLESLGFKPLDVDSYTYRNDKTGIVVITHVDDFLVFAPKGSKDLPKLKGDLAKLIDVDDMGPAEHFLGIRISRDRTNRKVFLSQEAYVDKVLDRHGMTDCKPVATPMEEGAREFLVPNKEQATAVEIQEYQKLLGEIGYLAYNTRIDLSFPCSALQRYLINPSEQHKKAAKRLLRYLKGTKDFAQSYGNEMEFDGFNLHGYSDSNWASADITTWRSHSGWVFILNGGVVSASSKRQTTIALSSTEAELYAMCKAAQEAAWIRQIMRGLAYESQDGSQIRLYGDNQGALALVENPELHQRTKHIAVKWFYIRQQAERQEIDVWYCPTTDMVADGLTKLGSCKIWTFCGTAEYGTIARQGRLKS